MIIIIVIDQLSITFIIVISAIKLREGGAAIFLILSKNHHKVILGKMFISPRLISNLRLPVRSYTMLARQNKPEEAKP